MLRISLFFTLTLLIWPPAAPARGSADEILQIFEFDYDQKNTAEPETPPPPPARASAPQAPEVKPPAPPRAPEVKPAAPAQGGVITIIGEPDPPGAVHNDFLPDHRAEEITLSPAGFPPTTSIPAKPGEARVEKTKPAPARPAKARPTPARPVRPGPAPATFAPLPPDPKPGSVNRFWRLAQRNWARYGGAPESRTLQDLARFPGLTR